MYKIRKYGRTIFKSRSWSEATQQLQQLENQHPESANALSFVLIAD